MKRKLFDVSLSYFKKSLDFIDDNFEIVKNYSQNNNNALTNLGFLYSIAYIKIYLKYYVEYCTHSNDVMDEQEKIVLGQLLSQGITERNKNQRKVIQIYVLKLFRKTMKTFDDLKVYKWNEKKIPWKNEFNFEEKATSLIDYSFFNIQKIQQYEKLFEMFHSWVMSNFKSLPSQMDLSIKQNGILEFFDVIINQIVCNLFKKEYQNSTYYINFSASASNFINSNTSLALSAESKKLLLLYYNKTNFQSSFLKEHNVISLENFEILLYSYKLAFISSLANSNTFYNKLFSQSIINTINNSYIPGGEPNADLIIRSFPQIENYLVQTNNPSCACYVCSCNSWYSIDPCGLPAVKSKCSNCGKDIGGEDHYLVPRYGHYSVYKYEEHKISVSKRWYYHPLPWKDLETLRKEV